MFWWQWDVVVMEVVTVMVVMAVRAMMLMAC